jgi:hypothetical protein
MVSKWGAGMSFAHLVELRGPRTESWPIPEPGAYCVQKLKYKQRESMFFATKQRAGLEGTSHSWHLMYKFVFDLAHAVSRVYLYEPKESDF